MWEFNEIFPSAKWRLGASHWPIRYSSRSSLSGGPVWTKHTEALKLWSCSLKGTRARLVLMPLWSTRWWIRRDVVLVKWRFLPILITVNNGSFVGREGFEVDAACFKASVIAWTHKRCDGHLTNALTAVMRWYVKMQMLNTLLFSRLLHRSLPYFVNGR